MAAKMVRDLYCLDAKGGRLLIGEAHTYADTQGNLYEFKVEDIISCINSGEIEVYNLCVTNEGRLKGVSLDGTRYISGSVFEVLNNLNIHKETGICRPMIYGDVLYYIDGGRIACKLAKKDVKEIRILDVAEIIDVSGFSGCTSLETVHLPANLKEIRAEAFYGCQNLRQLVCPEGLTLIDMSAFEGCSSLGAVKFNKKLKTIGVSAFSRCSSLRLAKLPHSIRLLGERAFYGCSSLNMCGIPSGVREIKKGTFVGCSSLENLVFFGDTNNIKISKLAFDSTFDLVGLNCA